MAGAQPGLSEQPRVGLSGQPPPTSRRRPVFRHHPDDTHDHAEAHLVRAIEETAMASAKLTQALTDLAAAVAAYEAGKGAPDPRVAELEAQNADLTAQLATAQAAVAAAETDDDAAADQIEAAVTSINPQPAPVPEPVAALPQYTYSGDPNALPTATDWTPNGATTTDGQPLYTFSGDTAGQPPTGDGLGGVWHLYVPPVQ